MVKHTSDHMAAIKSGKVTKTNVIGLRKAINASERRYQGLSTSSTAPTYTAEEVADLERALAEHEPKVTGKLHDSGLALLRSPRYRKRLAPVADVIDKLQSFHLVSFDRIGRHDMNCVPVFRARSKGRSFLFRNIPWQSGGNGPEILGSVT